METFKDAFNIILAEKMKLPKGEIVVSELPKLGKKKDVVAIITSVNDKFNLYIDNQKLNTFKSEKEALKSLKDFLKVMDV
jgi:Holliday junction resolvasome RuvABC ATP-dependent DNA helicase subunit